MNPHPTLTNTQLAYLQGLRAGDTQQSGLQVRNLLTDPDRVALAETYQADADRFRTFLADNGQLNPAPKALGMRIPKQRLIDLLTLFNTKHCLLETNCFGFTKSVKAGGQLVLISRGSFWQSSPIIADEVVYDNFYTETTIEEATIRPTYIHLSKNKPLKDRTAQRYIRNFLKVYPDMGLYNMHGYLFPIRAMLHLLNDDTAFGAETHLRLSWGLITYLRLGEPPYTPGNFSLLIKADNPDTNGFVIEFRTDGIVPNDGCPPKGKCN